MRAGDRRQRVERGAAVPLDQVDRLAWLEPALQDQRRTVRQRGRHRVRAAIGPEQRRRQQNAVIRPIALALADVEAVLDDAAMRQRHRFRPAAGAGRVDDDGVIRRTRSDAGRWPHGGPAAAGRSGMNAAGRRLRSSTTWRRSRDSADDSLQSSRQRGGEVVVAEPVQRNQHAHRRILQQPVEFVRRRPRAEGDHDTAGDSWSPKNASSHSGRLLISRPTRSPRAMPSVAQRGRDRGRAVGRVPRRRRPDRARSLPAVHRSVPPVRR